MDPASGDPKLQHNHLHHHVTKSLDDQHIVNGQIRNHEQSTNGDTSSSSHGGRYASPLHRPHSHQSVSLESSVIGTTTPQSASDLNSRMNVGRESSSPPASRGDSECEAMVERNDSRAAAQIMPIPVEPYPCKAKHISLPTDEDYNNNTLLQSGTITTTFRPAPTVPSSSYHLVSPHTATNTNIRSVHSNNFDQFNIAQTGMPQSYQANQRSLSQSDFNSNAISGFVPNAGQNSTLAILQSRNSMLQVHSVNDIQYQSQFDQSYPFSTRFPLLLVSAIRPGTISPVIKPLSQFNRWKVLAEALDLHHHVDSIESLHQNAFNQVTALFDEWKMSKQDYVIKLHEFLINQKWIFIAHELNTACQTHLNMHNKDVNGMVEQQVKVKCHTIQSSNFGLLAPATDSPISLISPSHSQYISHHQSLGYRGVTVQPQPIQPMLNQGSTSYKHNQSGSVSVAYSHPGPGPINSYPPLRTQTENFPISFSAIDTAPVSDINNILPDPPPIIRKTPFSFHLLSVGKLYTVLESVLKPPATLIPSNSIPMTLVENDSITNLKRLHERLQSRSGDDVLADVTPFDLFLLFDCCLQPLLMPILGDIRVKKLRKTLDLTQHVAKTVIIHLYCSIRQMEACPLLFLQKDVDNPEKFNNGLNGFPPLPPLTALDPGHQSEQDLSDFHFLLFHALFLCWHLLHVMLDVDYPSLDHHLLNPALFPLEPLSATTRDARQISMAYLTKSDLFTRKLMSRSGYSHKAPCASHVHALLVETLVTLNSLLIAFHPIVELLPRPPKDTPHLAKMTSPSRSVSESIRPSNTATEQNQMFRQYSLSDQHANIMSRMGLLYAKYPECLHETLGRLESEYPQSMSSDTSLATLVLNLMQEFHKACLDAHLDSHSLTDTVTEIDSKESQSTPIDTQAHESMIGARWIGPELLLPCVQPDRHTAWLSISYHPNEKQLQQNESELLQGSLFFRLDDMGQENEHILSSDTVEGNEGSNIHDRVGRRSSSPFVVSQLVFTGVLNDLIKSSPQFPVIFELLCRALLVRSTKAEELSNFQVARNSTNLYHIGPEGQSYGDGSNSDSSTLDRLLSPLGLFISWCEQKRNHTPTQFKLGLSSTTSSPLINSTQAGVNANAVSSLTLPQSAAMVYPSSPRPRPMVDKSTVISRSFPMALTALTASSALIASFFIGVRYRLAAACQSTDSCRESIHHTAFGSVFGQARTIHGAPFLFSHILSWEHLNFAARLMHADKRRQLQRVCHSQAVECRKSMIMNLNNCHSKTEHPLTKLIADSQLAQAYLDSHDIITGSYCYNHLTSSQLWLRTDHYRPHNSTRAGTDNLNFPPYKPLDIRLLTQHDYTPSTTTGTYTVDPFTDGMPSDFADAPVISAYDMTLNCSSLVREHIQPLICLCSDRIDLVETSTAQSHSDAKIQFTHGSSSNLAFMESSSPHTESSQSIEDSVISPILEGLASVMPPFIKIENNNNVDVVDLLDSLGERGYHVILRGKSGVGKSQLACSMPRTPALANIFQLIHIDCSSYVRVLDEYRNILRRFEPPVNADDPLALLAGGSWLKQVNLMSDSQLIRAFGEHLRSPLCPRYLLVFDNLSTETSDGGNGEKVCVFQRVFRLNWLDDLGDKHFLRMVTSNVKDDMMVFNPDGKSSVVSINLQCLSKEGKIRLICNRFTQPEQRCQQTQRQQDVNNPGPSQHPERISFDRARSLLSVEVDMDDKKDNTGVKFTAELIAIQEMREFTTALHDSTLLLVLACNYILKQNESVHGSCQPDEWLLRWTIWMRMFRLDLAAKTRQLTDRLSTVTKQQDELSPSEKLSVAALFLLVCEEFLTVRGARFERDINPSDAISPTDGEIVQRQSYTSAVDHTNHRAVDTRFCASERIIAFLRRCTYLKYDHVPECLLRDLVTSNGECHPLLDQSILSVREQGVARADFSTLLKLVLDLQLLKYHTDDANERVFHMHQLVANAIHETIRVLPAYLNALQTAFSNLALVGSPATSDALSPQSGKSSYNTVGVSGLSTLTANTGSPLIEEVNALVESRQSTTRPVSTVQQRVPIPAREAIGRRIFRLLQCELDKWCSIERTFVNERKRFHLLIPILKNAEYFLITDAKTMHMPDAVDELYERLAYCYLYGAQDAVYALEMFSQIDSCALQSIIKIYVASYHDKVTEDVKLQEAVERFADKATNLQSLSFPFLNHLCWTFYQLQHPQMCKCLLRLAAALTDNHQLKGDLTQQMFLHLQAALTYYNAFDYEQALRLLQDAFPHFSLSLPSTVSSKNVQAPDGQRRDLTTVDRPHLPSIAAEVPYHNSSPNLHAGIGYRLMSLCCWQRIKTLLDQLSSYGGGSSTSMRSASNKGSVSVTHGPGFNPLQSIGEACGYLAKAMSYVAISMWRLQLHYSSAVLEEIKCTNVEICRDQPRAFAHAFIPHILPTISNKQPSHSPDYFDSPSQSHSYSSNVTVPSMEMLLSVDAWYRLEQLESWLYSLWLKENTLSYNILSPQEKQNVPEQLKSLLKVDARNRWLVSETRYNELIRLATQIHTPSSSGLYRESEIFTLYRSLGAFYRNNQDHRRSLAVFLHSVDHVPQRDSRTKIQTLNCLSEEALALSASELCSMIIREWVDIEKLLGQDPETKTSSLSIQQESSSSTLSHTKSVIVNDSISSSDGTNRQFFELIKLLVKRIHQIVNTCTKQPALVISPANPQLPFSSTSSLVPDCCFISDDCIIKHYKLVRRCCEPILRGINARCASLRSQAAVEFSEFVHGIIGILTQEAKHEIGGRLLTHLKMELWIVQPHSNNAAKVPTNSAKILQSNPPDVIVSKYPGSKNSLDIDRGSSDSTNSAANRRPVFHIVTSNDMEFDTNRALISVLEKTPLSDKIFWMFESADAQFMLRQACGLLQLIEAHLPEVVRPRLKKCYSMSTLVNERELYSALSLALLWLTQIFARKVIPVIRSCTIEQFDSTIQHSFHDLEINPFVIVFPPRPLPGDWSSLLEPKMPPNTVVIQSRLPDKYARLRDIVHNLSYHNLEGSYKGYSFGKFNPLLRDLLLALFPKLLATTTEEMLIEEIENSQPYPLNQTEINYAMNELGAINVDQATLRYNLERFFSVFHTFLGKLLGTRELYRVNAEHLRQLQTLSWQKYSSTVGKSKEMESCLQAFPYLFTTLHAHTDDRFELVPIVRVCLQIFQLTLDRDGRLLPKPTENHNINTGTTINISCSSGISAVDPLSLTRSVGSPPLSPYTVSPASTNMIPTVSHVNSGKIIQQHMTATTSLPIRRLSSPSPVPSSHAGLGSSVNRSPPIPVIGSSPRVNVHRESISNKTSKQISSATDNKIETFLPPIMECQHEHLCPNAAFHNWLTCIIRVTNQWEKRGEMADHKLRITYPVALQLISYLRSEQFNNNILNGSHTNSANMNNTNSSTVTLSRNISTDVFDFRHHLLNTPFSLVHRILAFIHRVGIYQSDVLAMYDKAHATFSLEKDLLDKMISDATAASESTVSASKTVTVTQQPVTQTLSFADISIKGPINDADRSHSSGLMTNIPTENEVSATSNEHPLNPPHSQTFTHHQLTHGQHHHSNVIQNINVHANRAQSNNTTSSTSVSDDRDFAFLHFLRGRCYNYMAIQLQRMRLLNSQELSKAKEDFKRLDTFIAIESQNQLSTSATVNHSSTKNNVLQMLQRLGYYMIELRLAMAHLFILPFDERSRQNGMGMLTNMNNDDKIIISEFMPSLNSQSSTLHACLKNLRTERISWILDDLPRNLQITQVSHIYSDPCDAHILLAILHLFRASQGIVRLVSARPNESANINRKPRDYFYDEPYWKLVNKVHGRIEIYLLIAYCNLNLWLDAKNQAVVVSKIFKFPEGHSALLANNLDLNRDGTHNTAQPRAHPDTGVALLALAYFYQYSRGKLANGISPHTSLACASNCFRLAESFLLQQPSCPQELLIHCHDICAAFLFSDPAWKHIDLYQQDTTNSTTKFYEFKSDVLFRLLGQHHIEYRKAIAEYHCQVLNVILSAADRSQVIIDKELCRTTLKELERLANAVWEKRTNGSNIETGGLGAEKCTSSLTDTGSLPHYHRQKEVLGNAVQYYEKKVKKIHKYWRWHRHVKYDAKGGPVEVTKSSDRWIPDEQTDQCMCCEKTKFNFVKRRHRKRIMIYSQRL